MRGLEHSDQSKHHREQDLHNKPPPTNEKGEDDDDSNNKYGHNTKKPTYKLHKKYNTIEK